ncbi:MAG TPA: hypothetical protein VHN74_20185 [Candidatus Angelobacter sp.]|jgi:hypothetical protein|nr:hypothetical protein [Candidatus Angelobacter sp.]
MAIRVRSSFGSASGHFHLNVHGYGMVVLTQAIWFVAAGVQLWNVETLRGAAARA